jgi:glucosylceramidase
VSALHRLRTPRAGAGAAALTLALVATGLGLTGGGTAQAADPVAQVWITTPDGSRKLSSDGSLAFNSSPQSIDLRIDSSQKGQRYTGAGASVTGASAHLIQGLSQDRRNELMRSLFSTSGDGIGLSYLRQPLGSSDFDASSSPHSYEDTRGQFSIDRDKQEIIPVVKQALGVNPSIRLMGTPWSPPAWMKTNNSLNGGSLRSENYGDYADYLVKAIKAYGQEGITLTDLTVQNEPENPTSYPSMSMTSAEQAEFVKVLDPKLTAAGLPTNILAFDHNWDHPNYPLDVFSRTNGISRVIGAAFHCYGGDPSAEQQVASTGKRVFFTECSGTDSDNKANTFGDSLRWQAQNLVVQNMRNGGETVLTWNLALDQNGGPHQGLCGTRCNGVVEIANGSVNRGAEYYSLGHISKFVKVGATRIGSTSQGSGGVQDVAFQNPDGTRVAYVVNTSGGSQRFSVTDSGRSLAYTLAAGAVATFVWNPSGDNGGSTGPIDSSAWYQVANTGSSACLDDTDWGTANGTALQQWACGGGANQKWQFRSTGDGYYQVVNQYNNKSWDVDGGAGATADGTKVHLWDYVGGTNQQWRAESVASGQYRFVARHSGKCLSVDGGSTANGTKLSQQPCSGAAAQSFRLSA